ncbi:NCS2 family permease [Domibacillus robiginosus]|uniref:NCS2 family permease n=1 Tax=Domibacillus robiginosus TaxID=1071054 RepID=UPI00067CFAAF|nr:NCS2 family permease [Domibacillus robiginosus]
MNGGIFKLREHGTTFAKEWSAGVTGFLTVIYIIAVNGLILSEAGMPFEAAAAATIISAAAGCLIMAFWANAPVIIVPGMGINAMFTYTFVQEMGMTWQQALGVTVMAGLLFAVVTLTPLAGRLNAVVPGALKEAITIGLGLFLIVIGVEKAGFSWAALLTLAFALILYWRKVPGTFIWVIAAGTGIAWLFGTLPDESGSVGLESYADVLNAWTFQGVSPFVFVPAVFSLTMVLLFENIGLVHGHLNLARQPEKFKRTIQANAAAVVASGLAGSSANVSAVESAAPIASGGRTGLVPLTAGLLFPLAFIAAPYLNMVPGSAVAPILIIIGTLMTMNIRRLPFSDWTESIPALAIIALIPLTSSIADGIAAGFILYPLLKMTRGRFREVPVPMYVIAVLFLMNTMVH